MSNLLFSLYTESFISLIVFSAPKASNYFFNLIIFDNLFLAHVCDYFIISLNVSFGVILEYIVNNSNIWSHWGSKSIVCCCCWFSHMVLVILVFDFHTNDLILWEYFRPKLALISSQEGFVFASIEILGMPPIWDNFSPLKLSKPILPMPQGTPLQLLLNALTLKTLSSF